MKGDVNSLICQKMEGREVRDSLICESEVKFIHMLGRDIIHGLVF